MRRLKGWAWGGGITTALFWMCISIALLGLATAYGFHLIQVQRQEGCEARNQSTQDGAHVVVKALIKAAGPDTAQTRLDAFLDDVDTGLVEVQVDC